MTKANFVVGTPAPSLGDMEKADRDRRANELVLSEFARESGAPVFWLQKIVGGRRDPIDWCLDLIEGKMRGVAVATEPCETTVARPIWLEDALVVVGTLVFVVALCLFT